LELEKSVQEVTVPVSGTLRIKARRDRSIKWEIYSVKFIESKLSVRDLG
jgi:hypothetical protein